MSAKLVLRIDTEFIKNKDEESKKQNCETNAVKRLLNRMKKDYSRLQVYIQADNLYKTQPMMELYRKNGIYDIGHLNSRDSNAMKNHYLLTQISDIIMQ